MMKATITSLLSPQNHEQPMVVDDQSAPGPFLRDEISQAVSSVLNEEIEKVKEVSILFYIIFLNRMLKTLIHENSMMQMQPKPWSTGIWEFQHHFHKLLDWIKNLKSLDCLELLLGLTRR